MVFAYLFCFLQQLDHEDYAQLLATVKSANMDLSIDWYPYTDFT